MIYLQKTDQLAIQHVSRFINENWIQQDDQGNFRYQNISFEDIKNPARTFKNIFISEQSNFCCYCYRKITTESTELEHIIPRAKTSRNEFNDYYQYSEILRNNVIPQREFVEAINPLPLPPFPHHIAYHNIVASCNGRTFNGGDNFTCNRQRGDLFIPPFNLMDNSVNYLPDGTLKFQLDLSNQTFFNILNLNKEILKKIRKLWALFVKSNLPLETILDNQSNMTTKEKVTLAVAESINPTKDIVLIETFSVIASWEIFKEYSFFFSYYQRRNGVHP